MKRVPRVAVGAVLLLGLLFATNRWLSWAEGIRYLQASDVLDSYQPIAKAAPGFPAQAVPFHKAQRLALPYAVGVAARTTGISVGGVFSITLALLQIFLLAGLSATLSRLRIPPRRALVAFALFAMQPYALRYYWVALGLANDVLFDLGALALLAGLWLELPFFAMGGLALAALARQTALLLLPGAIFYVFALRGLGQWKRAVAEASAMIVVAVGLYEVTAILATKFAAPSYNADHVLGLFAWLRSERFQARIFAEHTLRCVLPLLLPILLVLGENPRRWNLRTASGVLMAAAIASQPFLGGPEITGQNAGRLVTLALLPLVLAWATASAREMSRKATALACGLLFLESFHHQYTLIGPSGPAGTALLQGLVALAVVGVMEWERNFSNRPISNMVGPSRGSS